MRRIKCSDKIRITGNWECKSRRRLISGLGGCLCNKENCYKLAEGKAMRKHNYVVGYEEEGKSVCGKNGTSIRPLTLIQAKKLSRQIVWRWNGVVVRKSVIYKLVKVGDNL